FAFAEHKCAFAGTLVDHLDNAQPANHRSLGRQRTVQGDALFAVDDFDPVDSGVALARPEPGMAEHRSHGRQHFQILFVNEGELVLVHRIVAKTEPERIKNAVLRPIGLFFRRNFERDQLVVDDGHYTGPNYTGSQENTSPERSSGVNEAAKAPLS